MAALGAPAGANPCLNPKSTFRLPPPRHQLRYVIRCSNSPGAPHSGAYPTPEASPWNNNNINFSPGAPPGSGPGFKPPSYGSAGPGYMNQHNTANTDFGWRKGMNAAAPGAQAMNPSLNPAMNPPMNNPPPAMNQPPPAMNPPPGWSTSTGYGSPQHAHVGSHAFAPGPGASSPPPGTLAFGPGPPGASSPPPGVSFPPPGAPGYNPAPASPGTPGGRQATGYVGNAPPQAPRASSPPPRNQTSPRGGGAARGPMPEFKLPDGTTKWTSVDEMRRHYFPNAENEPPPKRTYKTPDPKAGGFVLPDGSRKWNSIDEMRRHYFPNEDFSAPPKRTYKPPDPKAGGFVLPDGSRKWNSIDEMRRFYFPNEDFSKPPKPFGSSKDSSASKEAENRSAVNELKKKYFGDK